MERQTTLSADGPGIEIIHLRGPRQGEIQHLSGNHIALGRSPDADVLFPPELRIVSRNHAEIFFQQGRYLLINQSRNGSFVNDEEVQEAWLYPGDIITLAPGGPQLSFAPEPQIQAAPATQAIAVADGETLTLQYQDQIRSFRQSDIIIGSADDCDLVLHHPRVHPHHLQLFHLQQHCRVRSLGNIDSILVNGIPMRTEMNLSAGDELLLHADGPGFRYAGEGKFLELTVDLKPEAQAPMPAETQSSTALRPESGLKKLFNFLLRR